MDKCTKLEPKEHIAAYLENRELIRYEEQDDANKGLLQKLVNNYIIVKNILKHLQWQDQLLCKLVCKTWHSAVSALQREILSPHDFVLAPIKKSECMILKKSGNISTEPLIILNFCNAVGFDHIISCKDVVPNPCSPPCENTHWVFDYINQELIYPKECMVVVQACHLSYMPLKDTDTTAYTYKSANASRTIPQICGVVIPKLQDVNYHVINLKGTGENYIKTDFIDVVDKIAETEIFKGVIVYVNDKFVTTDYVDEVVFLNHFKKIQPNIPFAFGGCIIEDVIYDSSELLQLQNNIDHPFVSGNVLSLVIFTVSKDESGEPSNISNFEMFSLVVESCDFSKPKIEKTIREFSETVPNFEHSLVFKLSCVGRDQRHKFEQETFRKFFPNTTLIGCYGNGELGHNHPERTRSPSPLGSAKRAKKHSPLCSILYSYSTVFIYCGWGKNID